MKQKTITHQDMFALYPNLEEFTMALKSGGRVTLKRNGDVCIGDTVISSNDDVAVMDVVMGHIRNNQCPF